MFSFKVGWLDISRVRYFEPFMRHLELCCKLQNNALYQSTRKLHIYAATLTVVKFVAIFLVTKLL